MLLAVGVLATVLQLGPPTLAPTPARASGEEDPVAVLDAWTETTQVYANPDGTIAATIASEPIQAPDPTSETGWSPIDETLSDVGAAVEPESVAADVSFSDGGSEPLASVSDGQVGLSIPADGSLPTPVLSGDTATYENVVEGLDEVVRATSKGFEVSFVVADAASAPESVDIPLVLDGLEASLLEDGSLVLADASETVVGGSEPAQLWGASTDPVTGEPLFQVTVPTTLTQAEGGPVLHLTPDPEVWTDPAMDFPAVIDPSISLSLSHDTYVNQASPTSSYGTQTTLRAGSPSGGGNQVRRTVIDFDRTSIAGAQIQSASLGLYQSDSGSCTATQLDLLRVNSMPGGALTWNSQPTVGAVYATNSSGVGHDGSCGADWVSLSTGGGGGTSLTSLVQLWADGTTVPAAIELRAHDESDTTYAKAFSSSEGAHPPVLSVTYDHAPDVPTYLYLEHTEDGSFVLHGTFTDADSGAEGYVRYTLVDTDPNPDETVLSAVHDTDTVDSGEDSPYEVPDGTIDETHSYTVTATAYDTILASAPTSTVPLKDDNCPATLTEEEPTRANILYKTFSAGIGLPPTIPLYMDEYNPEDEQVHPAIFLVHGGGWYYGCRRSLNHEAYTLAHTYGFDVFSIDYRMACIGTEDTYTSDVLAMCAWPFQRLDPITGVKNVAAQDVQDAIQFLWDNWNDPEEGFPYWDTTNVAALGTSAGGTVLLEAVASAETSEEKPQVVATWSATMSFSTFVTTPHDPDTDPYDSHDTCDHAHADHYHQDGDLGRAINCWRGVDHYLDSMDGEEPVCGFGESRDVDRGTTDVGYSSSTCGATASVWRDASPRLEWSDLSSSDMVPAFVANGGGPDELDIMGAEVVPLRDANEFVDLVLQGNVEFQLCQVDSTKHGTHYEDDPCNDDAETSVFDRTVTFIMDHLT